MSATVLACLTPAGAGAIATLAVRGPSAWTLVRELAQRELPITPQPGKFWLTRLGKSSPAETDELVVAVKQIEPEPWVELHCHGGREVVRLLEETFAAHGVEIRSWDNFGTTDPLDLRKNSALAVLAKAPTVRTANIALDQYHGALAQVLEKTRTPLLRGDAATAASILAEVLRFSSVGLHLNEPWRVVIAGPPNVGKSSLVNAIAGYQRSVVSSIPGTTRDVVTTQVALDGWPVEIADTAGWRVTRGSLEQEGIARARQAAAEADLCLWVLDTSAPPVLPVAGFAKVHLVVNKIDLPPAWPLESVDAVRVSAHSGLGVPELCQAMADWLVPDAPPVGAAVPFTAELITSLTHALASVQAGNSAEALAHLEGCKGAF